MKFLKKSLSIFLVILTILTTCSAVMPVFAAGDLFSSKTFVAESYVQQEMTSKIVGEVSELREEYAKHFVCEDGSYVVATYTEPVHYKENGKWKEIDNSLELTSEVKSSSGKAMYAPKSGSADVSIPQSFSNDQRISVTNKGHTISFGVSQEMNVRLNKSATVVSDVEDLSSNKQVDKVALLQKTMTASTASASEESAITEYNNEVMAVENQSGAIVYEDIFNNADLEYIVTTNSIKENIVVQKKQYDYTYSFDMDFGELVPIVNEDNSIRVVEPETEETVFFIAAPYMYDANGIESTEIDMSLVEEDGIYVLTLKASTDWINSDERVFPVVIDPTVYMSYNDVFVMSGVGNKNTTKVNKELRIGKNLTNSTRTYIKPELPSNIPAGSYIDSACLVLKKDAYFQGIGSKDIYAYAFDCYKIDSWDPSSITWNNQPIDNSKNGYESYDLELLSSVEASSDREEYTFAITNAVRRWFSGGVNNGLMLASSNESTATQVDFYSSRASDSNNYPELYITYTAPNVSISNWDTNSQAKESSAFTITTSSNWTVSSNASWISLSTTSGSGIGSSKIIVTENTSIFNRVGTVTVKMGSTVIGTITVTQYGAEPYLTVSPASLNFDVGSSKQTVNITSNTTWSFSNLPEWITVTPSEGSMNSSVEVEVSANNNAAARGNNISVTADTVIKTINVVQLKDTEAPTKPDIYEEDGLVYISSRTFDFDGGTETEEHIEYSFDGTNWSDYTEPLAVVRTSEATIYARVVDDARNGEDGSNVTSFTLENNLGEYTASYTDIALGEGLFPVEFGRTYTSTNGWFFTFDANVVKIDDNSYVFTDLYGEKQYFVKNSENKYISVDDEELTVNADSYVLTYGDMTCTFGLDGKINRIVTDYLDTAYTWTDNLLTITGGATVIFTDGKPTKINITREGQVKEVEYVWTEGNLTKFIDAADVEHNYAYTNGLLTENETETVIYSAEGRVKKIKQPNGAFVKYTYNDTAASADEETLGNIGAVTVSDSKGVTDVWYYADGFAISNGLYSYSDDATYDPNNISAEITTDTLSQVAYVITVPADETVEETYEEYPLYEEDEDGNFTFYSYDSENNVTAMLFVKADALTVTEETTFEQAETVAEEKSTYSYDTNGNVTSEIYQKRIDNELVNQEKTVYTYNDKESILTEKEYQWIDNSWYQTHGESYTYNGYGNITKKVTVVYTNTENPETGLLDISSKTTTDNYEYDAWCQQVKVTTNAGEEDETVSETVYDVFGRTVSVTADGKTTSYTYDNKGNVLTVTEDEETTTYTYADNGNLVSRTNPNGAVAGYTYDINGNLTGHTFNGYAFTYNTLGSILTANSESGELVNYTYSNTVEQEVLTSNFGNGQSMVYDYNEDGEITAIKLGEETKYGYEYFETTDDNGEVTKEWTELTDYVNCLKKIIKSSKTTVKDLNGNFIYSVENVAKDDDVEDSFDGVVTKIGGTVYSLVTEENKDTFKTNSTTDFTKEYTYVNDDLSSVVTAGLTTSYSYNADKLISILENTLNDVSKAYGYTYDDNGNITSETVTTKDADGNVEASETIVYTYDDKEQLISAETSSIKYEYTYDDRGNILTKKEYSISLDKNNEKVYTFIEANTDTYVYDETWKDKLISYNGQTIAYDAVGNPTNYMGNTLTWTMGRQLASFGDISYTYNEDGIRTSKTSNGVTTKFLLDGYNVIEQTDGTTILHFFYDSNDEVIGFRYNGNDYFYVKNVMSDIIAITDSNKNIVSEYRYDPWGKVLDEENLTAIGELNPFRYRSYYYDGDIEMYYLQNRYYDAEVGRFINADIDSIINSSVLNVELAQIISRIKAPDSNITSSYSLRTSRGGLSEVEKDWLSYSLIIITLFYELGLPVEYMNGTHSWTVDYLYYDDSKNYIEKVVFYSEFTEKNKSYEIILLTGSAYAWNSYIASVSVNGNRDVLPKIISLLGVIVSIVGIVYPGISIDIMGYCITAVGIFYDGLESGANAWSGKFYKYILDSTALLDASEFLSIIYQVYLIEKTNGKVIRTKIYDIERDL